MRWGIFLNLRLYQMQLPLHPKRAMIRGKEREKTRERARARERVEKAGEARNPRSDLAIFDS